MPTKNCSICQIAKTEPTSTTQPGSVATGIHARTSDQPKQNKQISIGNTEAMSTTVAPKPMKATVEDQFMNQSLGSEPGPPPTAAYPSDEAPESPSSPPLSPYSSTRQRIHDLTLPRISNFSIPPSPPPPSDPDDIAALSATTKKFDKFLELKKKGVHFNARLESSSSLRNPSLLPKLMEFAGVSLEDSYASTIAEEDGGVPVRWEHGCYVEELVRENERWRKRRRREKGEGVEFVGQKDVNTRITA